MAGRREECKVLIVDDDQLMCAAISQFLCKQGLSALCASNGSEALALVEKQKPDIVVADLCMPVMGGLDLLKKINSNGSPVPVIIMTGNPDLDSAIKAVQDQAYDYIIKPVHLPVLLQKIRQAFDKNRLAHENTVLSEIVSLYNVTSRLAATHNIDALLDVIFKCGLEMTGSTAGAIFLNEGQGSELVYARQRGIAAAGGQEETENARYAIAQQVFAGGKPLCIERGVPGRATDVPAGTCGRFPALIAVPLSVLKKNIGVFIVERDASAAPYSVIDTNRMEILASQAGIAINNAHLWTSLNQKLEELKIVSTFSEQLMGQTDKYELIRLLFEKVREQCGADVVGFLSVQQRYHEFIYWTRGAIDDADLWNVCRGVIEYFNQKAGVKIDERKVSLRPAALHHKHSGKVRLPLAFTHYVPIEWEDTAMGSFFIGSTMKRLENDDSGALIAGLANQIRIALINAKLFNDMKVNYIRTIKALAIAVDAKDKYTLGHSEKVMLIAEELARELKEFDEKRVSIVRDAALLHDIGKIGIPGHILNKPGPLSYDEFNGIMKSHSTLGANIVKDVPFLMDLYKLILHHHEHFDGTGYPAGLKGEDIPLGARILHVADAFDAMTSDRPYRSSLGGKEAVRRIVADSGKHFDPALVGAFLRIARRKGIID